MAWHFTPLLIESKVGPRFFLFAGLTLSCTGPLNAQDAQGPIREEISRVGSSEVIVAYKADSSDDTSSFSGYADSGKLVAQWLDLTDEQAAGAVRSIGSGNSATVTVDAQGLEKLLDDDRVELVAPVNTYEPALIESTQLVGLDAILANPLPSTTGSEQLAVAVIDTGVDAGHPFLEGRVVQQACFSENFPDSGITSLCRGGQDDDGYVTDLTANSAVPCNAAISGCGHGTHIAGIIGGKRTPDPRDSARTIAGMSPRVAIVAIQVYSRYENAGDCSQGFPAPCAKTSDPTLIRALEYVQLIELKRRIEKTGPKIIAVNMSLASGRRIAPCDTTNPLTRPINNLRGLGIPTFIASGNRGDPLGVSEPGCISTAFTVAASTKVGKVWTKSNRSTTTGMIDAMAPGVGVFSSSDGAVFAEQSGTSMATAVAAGAFALLYQQFPGRSAEDIEAAMKNGGHFILDDISNFQYPFVDVEKSFSALKNNVQFDATANIGPATPTGILFDESVSESLILELKPSAQSANDVVRDITKKSSDIFGSSDVTVRPLGNSNIAIESNSPISTEGIAKSLERMDVQGVGAVFSTKSYTP